MDETQRSQEQGPLPRSLEAVDWWLKKWGRTEPLIREDVERLIEVNGGTAERLVLNRRDLGGANLREANLQSANLRATNLQGANLWRANLQGANFRGANLQGASLQRANLQGASLWEANLQGASLRGADLQGASLWEANLQGADLRATNLQGADLRWANLQGANFRGAMLQEASLAEASISPDTDLEGVQWDPKYISALERHGAYEAASAVYRWLKEWYRGAGMLTIAGEFHYREQEASHKAGWQRLVRQFKKELVTAWRELKGRDAPASPEE